MEVAEYKKLLQQQSELVGVMQQQMLILQEQMRNVMTSAEVKSRVSVPWPQPLEVENGEPYENLTFFKSRWEDYCVATGMQKWGPEKKETQAGLLLSAIGSAAMKKYMDFGLTEDEKKNQDRIFQKMEEAIFKKTNIIYSRYLFNMRNQAEESFDDYLLTLKKLIRPCNYGDLEEDILRDRIVVGIKDGEVIKELLRKQDLSLESALNICRASERATAQVADLQKSEVNKISRNNKHNKSFKEEPKLCKFCGGTHVYQKKACPAWGQRCEECGGRNHFRKVCKKRGTVKEIHEDSDDSVVIAEVRNNKETGHVEAPLLFHVGDKKHNIYCTLDTGAHVCVMGGEFYKKLTGQKDFSELTPSHQKLKCFNGSSITNYGVASFECSRKEKKYKINFHIVNVNHEPLLSEKACVALGFIRYCGAVTSHIDRSQAEQIMKKYEDVFEGYGCLPGEISLEVDESVPARIQPARRVPVALREKLKLELQQLEADGIITKEMQHTDWVNNILIVSRDSKFRLCLDPIPLNKALKRPNFQFTTLDEMLPELSKAKVFSSVDAKKGFWQCRLTEESSKLTTFWTPFARYRWLRLPFGLCSSPEIFQQQLTSLLKDLKGIEIIADDILIYGVGETMEEAVVDHNIKFENLLKRLREINCKLNKDKVNLLRTSVKFYGHMLTNEGLKVDTSKVEAISKMPTPTSSKEVLRFLGMVGYLSRFINNLSVQATHLRRLTRQDVDFVWSEAEDKEFNMIKRKVSDLPTLQYFDINKEVVLECDASEYGLGAAMYQDNQVIAFASRCLTQTEKKYAQIEKEMLAVVFACIRFNQYIAGNSKIIVKTDHRPLINIVNKPLIEAPKRLQMMLLTLQKYNVKLQFIQGRENVVADTLSRAPVEEVCNPYDLEEKIKEKQVYSLISKISGLKYLKITDKLLNKIREESCKDTCCLQLMHYIMDGFPRYISDMPEEVKMFFKYKHELSTSEGFIFRNNQVLIPESLRGEMTQKVHVSHNGVASTLRLAKGNMFWPGMSDDIKEYVEKCSFCAAHAPSQQKLPLLCHDVPVYPFQYVSMDVFSVGDVKYLVTVDHYSDFFELDKICTLTANEIISICKKNFARHGIPQRVCTDNATNFANEVFKNFADKWNFEHVTSSPHHPESNGKAEATVKIAKKLVIYSQETKQDLWYGLLHQRNVPIQMDKTSPSQKLFSRRTRSGLPCLLRHLRPQLVHGVPVQIKVRKEKMKQESDKKCVELPGLQIGQKVLTQLQPEVNKKWSFGTVTKKIDARSYIIQVEDKAYRRSRIHIKPYAGGGVKGSHSNLIQFPDGPLLSPQNRKQDYSGFELVEPLVESMTPPSLYRPDEETRGQPISSAEAEESVRRSGRARTQPQYLRDYVVSSLKKGRCFRT
jgi:hypothetical protein